MRFKIFTAVNINVAAFSAMTPVVLVDIYQCSFSPCTCHRITPIYGDVCYQAVNVMLLSNEHERGKFVSLYPERDS